jgi:large subunit ribosomal protein L5
MYSVSKLSPIQPPPETSPSSPLFVPRKFGLLTRLKTYYEEFVAPNYLLMSIDPAAKPQKQPLPLRWDGSSPYHKNRPQPREEILPQLRQPFTAKNLPKIEQITVHSFIKTSLMKRAEVLSAALAFQSITGQRPEFITTKRSVAVFKTRSGIFPPVSEGGQMLI